METIRGKHASRKTIGTRVMALGSAAALAATLIPSAAAAEIGNGVHPTFDEAYYATVDYYGNLTEGAVVKSYALNGATSISDYGTYDDVINLTDSTTATTAGGKTTFNFGDTAPSHFYFEGKTAEPFDNLPWTISMSYTLNGVPTKAEDLAGKTGEVEITLNFVPNQNVSDYAKSNYTLEAMAAFNQDDILSLDAEGAQVQLVGNLRVVLFLCLPGEENHFTIQVGTDDFKFDGMTYLMVPATLSQLDQIADLSQRKDDLEDDYDKLNGSLDTMLDALNGMSGSLNATAAGLDELNAARGTISAGKGSVYADLDVTLDDLNDLAADLEPAQQHLETASQALTDISGDVNTLHAKAMELKPELKNLQTALQNLEDDLDDLKDGNRGSIGDVRSDLATLNANLSGLQSVLNAMNKSTSDMTKQLAAMADDATEISVNGMTANDIRDKANTVQDYHDAYEAGVKANLMADPSNLDETTAAAAKQHCDADTAKGCPEFKQVLITNITEQTIQGMENHGMDLSGYSDAQKAEAAEAAYETANSGKTIDGAAQDAVNLWIQMNDGTLNTELNQMGAVNSLLKHNGLTVGQLKGLMADFVPSTQALTSQLSSLCSTLGSNGLSGSLYAMLDRVSDSTDDVKSLTYSISNITKKASEALDDLDKLNTTVNGYIPEAQQALTDAKTMAGDATTSMKSMNKFMTDLEALSKKSGGQLDSGTQKTLTGLAATLRKAASSLSTTSDVKSAKDNLSDIIEDTWNEHTGDVDNLLNMDSTASAESLTSSQNGNPQSVQILIRSQEIKVSKESEDEKSAKKADQGSFWSRLAAMFKGIGSDFAGLFKH